MLNIIYFLLILLLSNKIYTNRTYIYNNYIGLKTYFSFREHFTNIYCYILKNVFFISNDIDKREEELNDINFIPSDYFKNTKDIKYYLDNL